MGIQHAVTAINNEVFIRTQLGAQEVANVIGSALPREARTLLILIDGRKDYAQITRLLENRKMFRSAGGLKHHLKMLIDLDYIKFNNQDLIAANEGLIECDSEHCEITLFTKTSDQETALHEDHYCEIRELDAARRPGDQLQRVDSLSLEKLRSIVSALISKQDEKAKIERHLKSLKECSDLRCIFELIQTISAESTGQFQIALNMAARAFKNAKVV